MLAEIKYGKHIQGEAIDFTMHECGSCGIPFFVPTRWLNNKVQSKGEYTCPNGCTRVFIGKSEVEKLKEKLTESEALRIKTEQDLQNKWLDEMNKAIKLEKQLKRVHKGVCPCCNRSFQNLAAHMKTKHPDIIKPKLQTI